MDAQHTGNKIAGLRKAKNWTQKDVAEKLHVSIAAVSKWERGLNYPDLSMMEPLAEVLDVSVSELLGLENEPADLVIKNITALSEEEKKISEKRFWKVFCAVASTMLVFLASVYLVFLSITNTNVMKLFLENVGGSGVLNLMAIVSGLAAWVLALCSIFSARRTTQWKNYSLYSMLCCAISLHIPTLVTYLTMRFEHISTVEDVIGADYFGSVVLLVGTILFNLCSTIIHREKTEKE